MHSVSAAAATRRTCMLPAQGFGTSSLSPCHQSSRRPNGSRTVTNPERRSLPNWSRRASSSPFSGSSLESLSSRSRSFCLFSALIFLFDLKVVRTFSRLSFAFFRSSRSPRSLASSGVRAPTRPASWRRWMTVTMAVSAGTPAISKCLSMNLPAASGQSRAVSSSSPQQAKNWPGLVTSTGIEMVCVAVVMGDPPGAIAARCWHPLPHGRGSVPVAMPSRPRSGGAIPARPSPSGRNAVGAGRNAA